jgi:hypothetical protein
MEIKITASASHDETLPYSVNLSDRVDEPVFLFFRIC